MDKWKTPKKENTKRNRQTTQLATDRNKDTPKKHKEKENNRIT